MYIFVALLHIILVTIRSFHCRSLSHSEQECASAYIIGIGNIAARPDFIGCFVVGCISDIFWWTAPNSLKLGRNHRFVFLCFWRLRNAHCAKGLVVRTHDYCAVPLKYYCLIAVLSYIVLECSKQNLKRCRTVVCVILFAPAVIAVNANTLI